MARARNAVAKLRKIIGQWPETHEKLSHGAPTWWGGKKTFATYADNHHGDGRQTVWIKSTADAQEDLVAMNDEVFFVPPYVGPSGWIGVRLDVKGSDWTIVEGLLEEGYRMVAPKRALRELDGE